MFVLCAKIELVLIFEGGHASFASRYIPVALSSIALFSVITLGLSFVFTWITRAAMRRAGIYDIPTGGRKTHPRPVVYEGGIAMYLAFVVGILLAAWFLPELVFQHRLLVGLVVGATLTVAVGAADDLLDLPPWLKLAAQLGIGALMYQFDFRIERLSNPFGGDMPLGHVSFVLTVLWYALLMNGINMIDGMDGLAAGIAAISAVTLCAISLDLQQPLSALLALMVAAICLGFLPFNFNPATIFMGDAGALLLGFLLASVTLLSNTKAPAVLALMLAVGLPLFETVFAFLRRILRGQHPFRGDRRHLHHRFVSLGFSERRTVLICYYITTLFGVTAYFVQKMEAQATMAMVVIIAIGLLMMVENLSYLEKKSR